MYFFQVVYYVFAIIGMELFGNKIKYYGYDNLSNPSHLYCGNTLLNGSTFYESQYCGNNFNNVLNTFVVLFELMVVNQWHDILSKCFILIYFLLHKNVCVRIILGFDVYLLALLYVKIWKLYCTFYKGVKTFI